MAEDRKHSHKLSRLMCSCPPWWKPEKSALSLWYIEELRKLNPELRVVLLEQDDQNEDNWVYTMNLPLEWYFRPIDSPNDLYLITTLNCSRYEFWKYCELTKKQPVYILKCLSDTNARCTTGRGCRTIYHTEKGFDKYSADDFANMRASRDQLHAELLAHVWHPSRMARMHA